MLVLRYIASVNQLVILCFQASISNANWGFLWQYLLNEAAKYCSDIARDKSGCCVLQLCVENSQGETRDRLVAQIIVNALVLAEDPYGFVLLRQNLSIFFFISCWMHVEWISSFCVCVSSNYVVQHLLGSKIPQVTFHILNSLRGQYAALSQNKYGSNVVEKCLSVSTEELSSQIIMEILRNPSYPTASMLLVDQYGNFVIQSALMVAKVCSLGHMLRIVAFVELQYYACLDHLVVWCLLHSWSASPSFCYHLECDHI